MLEVEQLSVAYGEKLILKEVSLQAQEGTILGIIGPNGAGKTTLVRALSGVLPLKSGQVRVKGRSLAAMNSMERAAW